MTLLTDSALTTTAFRGRRLRRKPALRALVRETRLHPAMLVAPLFIRPGHGVREEIGSMPGQHRLSVDNVAREAEALLEAGVRSVLLFGLPQSKDPEGAGAWAADGIVHEAIRELRRANGDELAVIADVCLCEYTSHGHCGVLDGALVDNDATLPLLARIAVSLADAGADVVAPSAMMDGQVAAIRAELPETAILAYAAKHASAFYGPFRDAADSAPAFGDRRSYQMDGANAREAMREAELDYAEGADFLLVKPATAYLDILRMVRDRFDLPLAAYHVSGEYAMIKAAAARGWIDEERVMMETLTSIRRAGADLIITYYAQDAARLLK